MPSKATNPFQPPDDWVELTQRLPSLDKPRVVVSISAGRGSYRPVLDLSPEVSRLVQDEADASRDVVTVHLGDDFLPGDCREAAETLYSEACERFLDTKRGDGSAFIRAGRIKLTVLDGSQEVGHHSLDVDRKAFGETDDVVERGASVTDSVVRVLADHGKTIGQQFISLAKATGEQAASERAGIIEYARGALELTREAGEYRAASLVAMAEANAAGGIMATEAGQALLITAVDQIPKGVELFGVWLSVRKVEAEARKAEAEAKLAGERKGKR